MSACASLFTWPQSYFFLWYILNLNRYNNKNIYPHMQMINHIKPDEKHSHSHSNKKKDARNVVFWIIEFHIHVDISYIM